MSKTSKLNNLVHYGQSINEVYVDNERLFCYSDNGMVSVSRVSSSAVKVFFNTFDEALNYSTYRQQIFNRIIIDNKSDVRLIDSIVAGWWIFFGLFMLNVWFQFIPFNSVGEFVFNIFTIFLLSVSLATFYWMLIRFFK